jgi:methyl-accepting chemotaxis protein
VGDPYSITQILWSADPTSQRAIGMVVGLALLAAVTIFIPLVARLFRLFVFERRLRQWVAYAAAAPLSKSAAKTVSPQLGFDKEELRGIFASSPIHSEYEEFERRWSSAQLAEGIDRAPIRMIDIFDERPLLPFGPRRSLLPILPGLFLGVGVFAALTGLIPSLAGVAADASSGDARTAWMATQVGLALRASAWGFICAIGASLTGRLIEGAFDARSHALDEIVEAAFGSVSPGELAEITRQTQQRSLETLGTELSRFANELNERLDRGLQRIEQSTARSANLVSQEQRGALHTVVQELSLSVRQGVEHHLGELRGALQRAVEHQTSVTGGLAETFERMVENSHTQDRVARTLADSASSVEEAAHAMRASSVEMKPILEHLGSTSRGLADTAERMGDTQQVVARTAESVRSSLEYAATGVDDQRQFIEQSLGEIRRALVGLGDGIGDSLQRSLREVDDVLGGTVGQLRKTLSESNETIERLAGPIRAAEGSTRETHLALDRVRAEVEALGQWMTQAVKPLRSGLTDVENRAEEIARTMVEFTSHTRQIDKTMEALREGIHEESRRLQGTGSELSRRLKLASDSVGLLESTTSDAARRPRSDSTPPGRERNWSPAPQARGDDSSFTTPTARSTEDEGFTAPTSKEPTDPPGKTIDDSAAETSTATTASVATNQPTHGLAESDSDATDEQARGELGASGYRVGAPRAQGPDPYGRLDDAADAPSNVRHFPTRDRELGDDLKLSGLLGPRNGNESDATSESSRKKKKRSRRSAGTSPDDPSSERGASGRPADDSD